MTAYTYHRSADGDLTRRFKQEGEQTRLSISQDCEGIIKLNDALRDEQNAKGHRGEVFRRVATIPAAVYEQAVFEGWAEDEDAWKAWLNNPENRVFRVYEGRL